MRSTRRLMSPAVSTSQPVAHQIVSGFCARKISEVRTTRPA